MDFNNDMDLIDFRDELIKHNIRVMNCIDNGEDYSILLKEFNELGIRSYKNYLPALYSLNIIGPKYYLDGKDITLITNEFLYEHNKDNYNIVRLLDSIDKEIMPYYNKLNYALDMSKKNVKSIDDEKKDIFSNYINMLNKLHTKTYPNKLRFRKDVKYITMLKKNCEFRLHFDISELETTEDVSIIMKSSDKDKVFTLLQKLINSPINDFKKPDLKVWKDYFKVELPNKDDKISLNDFFKNDLGLDRTITSRYFKADYITQNIKQFIFSIGLYIELPLEDYIEEFMRLNGYSMLSKYETLNEYSDLYDREIMYLIRNGIDKDIVFHILNKFGAFRQKRI